MGKISIGVAGAIGVLVGLLLAPRKGSETRKQIARRSEPLQEAAKKAASKAVDAVKPAARMVGERVALEAAKDAASSAVDAVKPVTRMVAERVPLINRGNDGVKPEEPLMEASSKDSSISEGREEGAATGRKTKTVHVNSRH